MVAMLSTCKVVVLLSVKSVASNESYCELDLAMANHLHCNFVSSPSHQYFTNHTIGFT